MSNFLRKLRRNDSNTNPTGSSGKYLKYAIGEIFLVVIGILIALSINNWNERRIRSNYELLLLNEINNALTDDQNIINRYYLTRLETKETAIKEINKLAGERAVIDHDTFLSLFDQLQTDFLFSYDAGAYEALKANGLDRLSNDVLRSEIIRAYDSTLPIFKQFIDDIDNNYREIIMQLSFDFLGEQMIKTENSEWKVGRKLIVSNVLSNESFIKLLSMETEKAGNQRDRLDVMISIITDLQKMVLEEINRLD
jgi:uncharacterized protein DUF6090